VAAADQPGVGAPVGLVAGAAAVAVAAADEHHLADEAGVHPLAHLADGRVIAVVEAAPEDDAALRGGREHSLAFLKCPRQRLFAQDVLPSLDGGQGDVGVEVRRRADDHRVNVWARHHLLPADGRLAAEAVSQGARGLAAARRDDDQLVAGRLDDGLDAPLRLQAGADDGHSHGALLPIPK